ncbi:ABC transporter ATP-binding protein [bacterium]|nr:ABC transporter ATP-binding protein [bacterium]
MAIRAESLVKTYYVGENVIRALDHISVEIGAGEYAAITGPSGSGKSTLMHVVGCLDVPDEGTLRLGGDDVSRLPEDDLAVIRNQRIGFVFQSFGLLPRMNAVENVELPLLYAGHADAKERAMQALETVGLAHRAEHEPSQLSGGQQQRVAIARAVVTDPAIILADEPTGNLDSHAGDEIMNLFERLNEQGRTVIIVTHEPDIARRCRRNIHLRDGKLHPL